MADRLQDLILRLSADSRQLTAELRKVEGSNSRTTKRIESDWKGVAGTISGAFGKLSSLPGLGAIAGGVSFAGLASLAGEAQDAADSIDKLAGRLGISTTAIQEYQFAAGQAGIEQGELAGALTKFAKSVGEAQLGTGRARTSLEALGVAVRTAGGEARSVEAVFEDVVRSLARVEDAAVRSALAQRILGGSGAGIAQLAGQFDELLEVGRQLGIAIDEDVVRSLAESQDASEALSAVLDQRLSRSLALVSNAMVGIKERVVDFAEAVARAVERSELLQRVLSNLTPVGLIDDLAAVDKRIAATTATMEDLQSQAENFRRFNPGQPAAVTEQQLAPIFKKLAAETAALKELWARRNELVRTQAASPAVGLQIAPDALDTSKGKAASRAAAAEAKAAAREVEAAQQRLNSVIEASFTPAERLTSALDQLGSDFRAGKISAEGFAEGQEAIARQFDVLDEKIQGSALKEVDQIIEAGLTPAEKLIEQLDRIGQLYAEGSISAEQFALAQGSIEKQLQGIEADELKDSLKDLEQVGRGVFEGLTGALSDFILTGKGDFASLARSFASEFLQLGIKGFIGGALGGIPGLEGIFGGARAGGGPVLPGRAYLVGENGPELVVPRSAGFVVPNVGARGASVGAAMSGAAAAPIYVTVNNSSKSDVQTSQRVSPSGQREIEILVTDVIARDVSRGGPVGRAIDGRLGVRPRGV